jgi:hypothetical protein
MVFSLLRGSIGPTLGAPNTGGGGGGTSIASNPVTYALMATGSGTTYNVYSDANMDSVPWGSLAAGDCVNIYWKSTPYLRKFGLRAAGTSSNPVIVNGVTDASGNRPQFNFSGATTAAGCNPGGANNIFASIPAFNESLGGIVLKPGPSDPYGLYNPKWIQIQNLELFGAANGNSYITLAGNTVAYSSAAAIYLLYAQDILVQNCIMADCGFGFFTQAKDNDLAFAAQRVTVRSCRVYGNGVVGSDLEHNFYVQCANPIIEGNYIGSVRSGSLGSTYKSRSSGEIFRFNYVEPSARTCDWVQSEDNNPGIQTQPDYGTDYVYGNVLIIDGLFGGLHYGGDNLGEDSPGNVVTPTPPYRFQLYFFSNTVINRSNFPPNYRSSVFQLSLINTRCDSWDNIFYCSGTTLFSWAYWAGFIYLRGGNIGFGSIADARDGADAAQYEVTKVVTPINSDPLFVNAAANNFALTASSPALSQATGVPAGVPAGLSAYLVNYQPRLGTNGMVARTAQGAGADLGALEYGVS